jgi:hypothetical protein
MLFAGAASAVEAYKWVDKDGTVHYGDKPKHEAQFVDVKPGSGDGPTPDTRAHDAECEREKAQLETYRKAPGFKETNALGQTRDYTPEESKQYLDNFEKKVNQACAPQAPPK